MNEVTFNKLNENATLPTSPHEGDVGWASALAHTDHNVDQALDGVRVKAFAGRHFRDCVEASTEAIAPVED